MVVLPVSLILGISWPARRNYQKASPISIQIVHADCLLDYFGSVMEKLFRNPERVQLASLVRPFSY
jgi:uncharacterized membrane protein